MLAAFVDAFNGRNDVALLMKIGLRYVRDFRAVRQALDAVLRRHARRGTHPPVYVIAEELTGRSLNRLYQWADAYVSLHRSEGFDCAWPRRWRMAFPSSQRDTRQPRVHG